MSSTSSNEKLHIPPGGEKPLCVVCGEFTDGQHFDVRNFCRFCRYRKCVAAGMITDAVQSHRDTYGKRNLPSLEDSPPKISKDNNHSSFSSPTNSDSMYDGMETKAVSYPQFSTANSTVPSSSTTSFTLFPDKTYPMLETLQPNHLLPLVNHSNNNQQQQQPIQSNFVLKHLPKMVEGYQKFRSLRKASYSLFMDEPRFINSESIPESTYSNNKKSCQVESSLAYDMIMEYFEPFSQLSLDDRNKLFENFQGLLSCGEKGYNTCKAYGNVENNDRLIMTDGGYVKLGELSKYYSNSSEVNGDPEEVARFFGTSITYAVTIVIPAMVKAEIDDYIIVALYGLCLFQEGICGLSEETKTISLKIKDELLKDLYYYYRNKNLADEELNFKMSKVLLLIPKFEVSF
uniref:NR LBD domain-containing protein n=1 Tax=Panagrolaimus sp. ES5 TaxID=591445 RepID=A0AC34FKL0_9BILA